MPSISLTVFNFQSHKVIIFASSITFLRGRLLWEYGLFCYTRRCPPLRHTSSLGAPVIRQIINDSDQLSTLTAFYNTAGMSATDLPVYSLIFLHTSLSIAIKLSCTYLTPFKRSYSFKLSIKV